MRVVCVDLVVAVVPGLAVDVVGVVVDGRRDVVGIVGVGVGGRVVVDPCGFEVEVVVGAVVGTLVVVAGLAATGVGADVEARDGDGAGVGGTVGSGNE